VQPESAEYLHGLCNAGALLLNPADGSYGEFHVSDARDVLTQPCIIGGTRERVLTQLVSWAFLLFVYQPPQCGFCRSEQRLLLCALDGGTDDELADVLQISVSAVKKMWHSIYDRVGRALAATFAIRVAVLPDDRADTRAAAVFSPCRAHYAR
jgi:hypothetical protein